MARRATLRSGCGSTPEASMIRSLALTIVNRAPALRAAALVADDLRQGLRLRLGKIDSSSGALHSTLSLEDSLGYVEEVVADYLRYGDLERFRGTVAEVGPGDSAGVALLLRAKGCDRVHLVDRYYSHRDHERQRAIYEALSLKHGLEHLREGKRWDERALTGIEWKVGEPAERFFARAARHAPAYDLIVSRAVLEHMYDPIGALRDMVRSLRPGGRMLHKVDLRDHGMFSQHMDELTFLSFAPSIHRLMTRNSGRPNRVLAHRYRAALEALRREEPVQYELLVTCLVGGRDVVPHVPYEQIAPEERRHAEQRVESRRSSMTSELRGIAARDLAIAGLFIVVKKAERSARDTAER